MDLVVYDTGALIAAERGDRVMWRLHLSLLERGVVPSVPAPVLAQAWRGGPQAGLSRLLRSCDIVEMDEPRARRAGTACALTGTADVVDASAAVVASQRPSLLVTSDPSDLHALAEALGARVTVRRI